jgi:hypothetical protein
MLYHTAPASVINMPNPFNMLTLTPKTIMPSRMVRHCFTLPHTVMVSAPVFLFAENELTFRTNANAPFPARVIAVLRDGRGMERKESWNGVQLETKEENSPLREAKRKAWEKARGDMRKRISRGESARGPVMMRFEAMVYLND